MNRDLYNLLLTLELPVAYDHFIATDKEDIQEPPYIVYKDDGTDNFGADNKVYVSSSNYNVELYCKLRNEEIEKNIEDLFDDKDIFWEKSVEFIDSEKLYQVFYEIQI